MRREVRMHDHSNPIANTDSRTAICTLFEGDYHLGLAAFVNSLVRAGYSGTVWAGYRGPLPPWVVQLKAGDGKCGAFVVNGSITLRFLPLKTDLHLANFKPQFMLDLLANQASGAEYIWYFDPDIFLRRQWSFFEHWQQHGIALCEEIVNSRLSETDPLRWQWRRIGTDMGLGEPRALNRYFNSGMVGLRASYTDLLRLWSSIIEKAGSIGYDLKSFMPGNREHAFHSLDQDALNMALMYSSRPLSTMGPEGMGFVPGGAVVFHAVGHKPWRGSFLTRALAGLPPSDAAKFYLTQVSSPISVYSRPRLAVKRISCSAAAFLGRFYRRR
jgi:hypothetical protein